MRLLSAFFVALMLAAAVPTQAREQPRVHRPSVAGLHLKVGQPVPDFRGATNLASFRGKPLVISFYTVHCAPCIREIPVLNALHHQNPELQVLAITPDSAVEAAEYVKKRHLTWPIVTPGEKYLFDTLGVKAFPTFAILDAKGRLVGTTYGSDLDSGGEDGYATHAGVAAWVTSLTGINVK